MSAPSVTTSRAGAEVCTRVKDASGKTVTLNDYRGKNVMLVFYLGEECAHCMKQLHDIGGKGVDHFGHQLGMGMPEEIHTNSRDEIEFHAAID